MTDQKRREIVEKESRKELGKNMESMVCVDQYGTRVTVFIPHKTAQRTER